MHISTPTPLISCVCLVLFFSVVSFFSLVSLFQFCFVFLFCFNIHFPLRITTIFFLPFSTILFHFLVLVFRNTVFLICYSYFPFTHFISSSPFPFQLFFLHCYLLKLTHPPPHPAQALPAQATKDFLSPNPACRGVCPFLIFFPQVAIGKLVSLLIGKKWCTFTEI